MKHQIIDAVLTETRDPDPRVRRRATRELCPCEIKVHRDDVWERILELTRDPDLGVRRSALHTLIDGSPRSRADNIVAAFEDLRNDPNPRLRRHVRKLLARYRSTGKINLDLT